MVYRQIADCIIQSGIPCKGGKKGRSGKCLQYHYRYKRDSRLCFCKVMFVEISAVGTKSSMIDTSLTITFVIEQRYVIEPLLSKLLKEFRDGADRTSSVRELIVDGRKDFDKSRDLHEMFRRFDEFRLYEVIFPTWLGMRLERYLGARAWYIL